MWNKYTHNPVSLQSRGVELANQWDSGNKSFVVDEIRSLPKRSDVLVASMTAAVLGARSWRQTTDFIEMMDRTL